MKKLLLLFCLATILPILTQASDSEYFLNKYDKSLVYKYVSGEDRRSNLSGLGDLVPCDGPVPVFNPALFNNADTLGLQVVATLFI